MITDSLFIQGFLLSLFLFFVSVMAHELGHILYFHVVLKKKVILRFCYWPYNEWGFKVGYVADYKGVNNQDKFGIYFTGVVAGLLVIWFFSFFSWVFLILLIPYAVGCFADLKQIWALIRCN